VRRPVVLLAVLATSGALASGCQSAARDASCPTTLDYKGVSYTAQHLSDEVGQDDLGVGTERGCGDKGRWSTDVAVSRITGIDPGTALVTPVAAHVLYLADGVTVDELPSDVAELVTP
jgi:hypothetical protein